MDMDLAQLLAATVDLYDEAAADVGSSATPARSAFQWGGTIFAVILLILNQTGRRSAVQSNLLVLYLFTGFPTVLFKILRGQFGYWVSFLSVAANLFFPRTFTVSRFLLFVVTPSWVANGLRDSIVGCISCLIFGVLLVITEIRETGDFSNCPCILSEVAVSDRHNVACELVRETLRLIKPDRFVLRVPKTLLEV